MIISSSPRNSLSLEGFTSTVPISWLKVRMVISITENGNIQRRLDPSGINMMNIEAGISILPLTSSTRKKRNHKKRREAPSYSIDHRNGRSKEPWVKTVHLGLIKRRETSRTNLPQHIKYGRGIINVFFRLCPSLFSHDSLLWSCYYGKIQSNGPKSVYNPLFSTLQILPRFDYFCNILLQ